MELSPQSSAQTAKPVLGTAAPIPATINGRKEKPRPSAGGAEVLASSWRKNLPRSSAAGASLRKASLPSAAEQFGARGNGSATITGTEKAPLGGGAE
jgi:hypothetical protein